MSLFLLAGPQNSLTYFFSQPRKITPSIFQQPSLFTALDTFAIVRFLPSTNFFSAIFSVPCPASDHPHSPNSCLSRPDYNRPLPGSTPQPITPTWPNTLHTPNYLLSAAPAVFSVTLPALSSKKQAVGKRRVVPSLPPLLRPSMLLFGASIIFLLSPNSCLFHSPLFPLLARWDAA